MKNKQQAKSTSTNKSPMGAAWSNAWVPVWDTAGQPRPAAQAGPDDSTPSSPAVTDRPETR